MYAEAEDHLTKLGFKYTKSEVHGLSLEPISVTDILEEQTEDCQDPDVILCDHYGINSDIESTFNSVINYFLKTLCI